MIPAQQEIGAIRKVLPYGRYLTTMQELESACVPSGDMNRKAIWEAFQEVTALVRCAYGKLAAVWIGGSFITSETHPHDIDVVYLIDGNRYDSANEDPRVRYVTQVLLGLNPQIDRLNPLVDAYLFPVPPTTVDINYSYSVARGYWDQLWSKTRFDDGDDRWLFPAAGYLEVLIDGYGN